MGRWHKARYIMEYMENGEKKEHFIYANTLKDAKAQAKALAIKNDCGICYGLTFDQAKY